MFLYSATFGKEYSVCGNDNYISDFEESEQWCKRCVHFGTIKGNMCCLCSEKYPEITEVSFCGHCDKFSDTKKINLLKRCLLKIEGFEFKNKVR